ncbi:hypothetical protein D3C73_1273040 [compost metagenome]
MVRRVRCLYKIIIPLEKGDIILIGICWKVGIIHLWVMGRDAKSAGIVPIVFPSEIVMGEAPCHREIRDISEA